MNKKSLFLAVMLVSHFAQAKQTSESFGDLPKDHLLTVENETGHRIFIIEDKSFKKLNPQEAVTLYWKEPISKKSEHTIGIYYGGNVKDEIPDLKINNQKNARAGKTKSRSKMANYQAQGCKTKMRVAHKKASAPQEPVMIAQLKTNQPGTISLFYGSNGILKMERIS